MTDLRKTQAQAEEAATAAGLVGMGEYDSTAGEFEWYEGLPLGVVVGRNVKRLRLERALTQHELAQVWKRYGLVWARSKLAALETGGRPQVSAGELVLIALAMRVPIGELFDGPEGSRVSLAPYEIDFDAAEFAQLFATELPPIELTIKGDAYRAHLEHLEQVQKEQSVQADVELAQRLGIHPRDVIRVAMGLFDGRSLTVERDRRVERMGAMTVQERQAHRGHVTRELSSMIERRLEEKEQS